MFDGIFIATGQLANKDSPNTPIQVLLNSIVRVYGSPNM
jgi:hypothetical protein